MYLCDFMFCAFDSSRHDLLLLRTNAPYAFSLVEINSDLVESEQNIRAPYAFLSRQSPLRAFHRSFEVSHNRAWEANIEIVVP